MRSLFFRLFFLLAILSLASCRAAPPAPASDTPTPAPSETLAPAATATHTPIPFATFTPTAVSTSTPVPAPTAAPLITLDPSMPAYFVAPTGSDSAPGTFAAPWATPNHAAQVAQAGDTVYFRGGEYALDRQVRVESAGREDAWITFAAYPGEKPVFDFNAMPVGAPGTDSPSPHDQGAFNIEGAAYIRVMSLSLKNSHQAGFMIRDSSHVEILNCRTDTTFSPGIAAWDTNTDSAGTEFIRIIGNEVTNANTWEMIIPGYDRSGEPPHEAISIAGAQNFTVAYNWLHHNDKEGIDVKEVSKHGLVHHNLVEWSARQGIYVDAWFGEITDVWIYDNLVRYNEAGVAFSVENGKSVTDVWLHHNLIANNRGTGIFFSRWGDGPRSNIKIESNTVYHNGYGQPASGEKYNWLTGGLFFYSANLKDIYVNKNIFSDNQAFQVAYSDHWHELSDRADFALKANNITVDGNLVNDATTAETPIRVGWPGNYTNAWPFSGENADPGVPQFADVTNFDFTLLPGSPGSGCGAVDADHFATPWWKQGFPPVIEP